MCNLIPLQFQNRDYIPAVSVWKISAESQHKSYIQPTNSWNLKLNNIFIFRYSGATVLSALCWTDLLILPRPGNVIRRTTKHVLRHYYRQRSQQEKQSVPKKVIHQTATQTRGQK